MIDPTHTSGNAGAATRAAFTTSTATTTDVRDSHDDSMISAFLR